jgi:hypothetical protein
VGRARLGPVVRALAAPAVVVGLSGCFGYVRSDVGAVPVGENVRVYLAPQGSAMTELRELSAAAEPIVNGQLMERAANGLMLRVSEGAAGYYAPAIGQDVRIPSSEILQLERRRLDPLRTAIASGAVAASVATVVLAIMSDAFGSDPPGGEVEPQIRIPLPFGFR